MLERQREGIAAAKAAGKYRGRTPTAQRKAADVRRMKAAGLKPAEIAVELDISLRSYFSIVAEASAPRWA